LRLPGLTGIKVVSAQFIGGVKLPFTQESGGAIVLQMPAALPNENDSVIALTLESNAENIPLIEIK
jgi:hypothetical protein